MVLLEFPPTGSRSVSFGPQGSSDDDDVSLLAPAQPAFTDESEDTEPEFLPGQGEDLNEAPAQPPRPPRRERPPQSPLVRRATLNSSFTDGRRLKSRKHQGRRSRHRVENEINVISAFGLTSNDLEVDLDWGVGQDSRSHFNRILSNRDLLERFVTSGEDLIADDSDSDLDLDDYEVIEKEEGPTPFDPEMAFLNISANLRAAFKKHAALGMVEGLEEEIRSFFVTNPCKKSYVLKGLSSYERLLAHAASAYNFLNSRSFDSSGGERELRIDNPKGRFTPSDPSLAKYILARKEIVIQ